MSQFTVYQNPNAASRKAYPYILDVQNSVIDELSTRIVIPLGRLNDFGSQQMKTLSPVVEHDGEKFVLLTSQITSIPLRLLKKPVGSLSVMRSEIVSAIDFAITGI
ncbi:CcdB family protein [Leucothrix arctica]|uniref:Toxin CcdB n=1 Tax=Leucothrix arctica TaxID=1481894 RepID=A0A317CE82_9GAMM|nr:CcdB family protein [Leucothrix arctica]PWQ94600.1 plasmid maintenance protein CcdB [Leucothrix arctica]